MIGPHATGPWTAHAWFWIEVHSGLTDASGLWYLFWSGIVGDLALVGAAVAIVRDHNCQAKGCWRLGAHPVYRPDGTPTPYRTCKTHHPRVDQTQRVTPDVIVAASKTTLAQHDAHAHADELVTR